MTLTEPQLRAFLPALTEAATWATALSSACTRFNITAPVRLAAFLAQAAHESGEFKRLVENLNYSAKRLMQVWPARFPTLAFAQSYERQPEKIANYVYADRMGNGNTASGDGWRYRGRGFGLTGRENYRVTGQALQLPFEAEPDRVAQPDGATVSFGRFWQAKGLNLLADVNTLESFDQISRRINGGNVGLKERRKLWARAKAALV